MVDDNEVKRWIARLETEESSWANYEKLAVLYTIQNRQDNPAQSAIHAPVMYSEAPAQAATPAPVGDYGDSDFLRAIVGRDPERAWSVMDELMDSLKIVNERVYNSVMRKIGSL